jgi:tRNA threonylcarbamoyladenosine biosynthesis protein TsaB
MQRHEVTVRDVDCFAAASGPGSFTGVRVGLACIKGLAEAAGKAAVAVSNLRVLASFGTAPVRAVVMDARRGEVYAAVYDANGVLVSPETVATLDGWLKALPENANVDEFVCAGIVPGLAGTRFAGARITPAPRQLAAAIARIAAAQYASGHACDPAALDANYVRRSDAELFWRE